MLADRDWKDLGETFLESLRLKQSTFSKDRKASAMYSLTFSDAEISRLPGY